MTVFHCRFQRTEESEESRLLIATCLCQVCRHYSPTTHFIHLIAPLDTVLARLRYPRPFWLAPKHAPIRLIDLDHRPMRPEGALRMPLEIGFNSFLLPPSGLPLLPGCRVPNFTHLFHRVARWNLWTGQTGIMALARFFTPVARPRTRRAAINCTGRQCVLRSSRTPPSSKGIDAPASRRKVGCGWHHPIPFLPKRHWVAHTQEHLRVWPQWP